MGLLLDENVPEYHYCVFIYYFLDPRHLTIHFLLPNEEDGVLQII